MNAQRIPIEFLRLLVLPVLACSRSGGSDPPPVDIVQQNAGVSSAELLAIASCVEVAVEVAEIVYDGYPSGTSALFLSFGDGCLTKTLEDQDGDGIQETQALAFAGCPDAANRIVLDGSLLARILGDPAAIAALSSEKCSELDARPEPLFVIDGNGALRFTSVTEGKGLAESVSLQLFGLGADGFILQGDLATASFDSQSGAAFQLANALCLTFDVDGNSTGGFAELAVAPAVDGAAIARIRMTPIAQDLWRYNLLDGGGGTFGLGGTLDLKNQTVSVE